MSALRLPAPLVTIEGVARRLPLPLGLQVANLLARGYARVAFSTGASLRPWRVERFPDELAVLLGGVPSPTARRRLIEDRLAFVLAQWLVRRAIRDDSSRAVARLLPRIEVRGEQHLRAALALGRGAVAISTHFGFPHLIRGVLGHLGIPAVAGVGTPRRAEHIQLKGDVWSRARGLRRIRDALARNSVCVFLPDRALGTTASVPFLGTSLELGTGAFRVGSLGGAPIVPFFICAADRPARFRLDFSPPLRSLAPREPRAMLDSMSEFAALYAGYVRRCPSHLPYRSAGALTLTLGEEPARPAQPARPIDR